MTSARWVNVVAGAWLFASAWLFTEAAWLRLAQALLGMAVFLVAFAAMALARLRRINSAAALVAMVLPFALALPSGAAADNLLATGLVILVATLWPAAARLRRDQVPSPRGAGG
jgi:hypothetical protein